MTDVSYPNKLEDITSIYHWERKPKNGSLLPSDEFVFLQKHICNELQAIKTEKKDHTGVLLFLVKNEKYEQLLTKAQILARFRQKDASYISEETLDNLQISESLIIYNTMKIQSYYRRSYVESHKKQFCKEWNIKEEELENILTTQLSQL